MTDDDDSDVSASWLGVRFWTSIKGFGLAAELGRIDFGKQLAGLSRSTFK